MHQEFQRIAIVNRGEPAMRFIHAVREFNQQYETSLRSIALYTDPDRNAMFVREADEAFCLGPAQISDPTTKHIKSSYVDYAGLERALKAVRAEAVWVGWGFVAEHADFADLCRENGIVFIGPSGDVMRRLGDKIASKLLAEQADIPVAPWSGGPVETVEEAFHHAEKLGYPVFIKATAGGGGHGIRRVRSAEELPEAFDRARSEAFKAFGNPTVFLEQLLQGARHIEVQVIADHHGAAWAAGVRDCTIQRRHQKILEEAPSPALSPDQDRALRAAAIRLSQAAGYQNAGTVEFLYDPTAQRFAFMEMNTRLQVEHPVTECTTGLDLVKLQIHVARGGRLDGEPPATTGHAIEVRLNAEDAENGFAPAPGRIERFRVVTGPGVRVDTGVSQGDSVPPEFDSMIAKIIACGRDRKEALARLKRALRESVVVINGGASNKAFLLELLNRSEVRDSAVDTGWLDRLAASGEHVSRQYADIALIAASIEAYDSELAIEQTQFYASAVRGRPQVTSRVGRSVALRYRGQPYSPKVYRVGVRDYRVQMSGSSVDIQVGHLGPFEYSLNVSGRRFHVVSIVQGPSYVIEVDGIAHRVERDDGGVVHAPSPAVVVSISVKPGDVVATGDRLLVLEAMKMEMPVVAPFPGKVRTVSAIPNVQVDAGAPLVQIDPGLDDQICSTHDERLSLTTSVPPDAENAKRQKTSIDSLAELRQQMLGFDVEVVSAAVSRSDPQPHSSEGHGIRQAEDEILNIFVDICSLFQRDPTTDGSASAEAPSAEALLFSYLRAIETRGEGLPASFLDALGRTLSHYGVSSLDPSPELEAALLWIYKSHQRLQSQVTAMLKILEHRLLHVEALRPKADQSFHRLLDRMVSLSRETFPVLRDLASEVRYRYFDKPMFEHARNLVYAEVEDHLNYVAANPDAKDRLERMRALVDCAQPVLNLFARRFGSATPALRQFMLEVLTRRYYRIRMLVDVGSSAADGHCYASAEYDYAGKRIHVLATHAEYAQLADAGKALFQLMEQVPASDDIVIDFYLWNETPRAPEQVLQEICSTLDGMSFPHPLRRIVIAIGSPEGADTPGATQLFTFRSDETGKWGEDKFYRGIHPLMGKRLHLWRLNNFDITRLPSAEDVYLLHAVARGNPKDERLFACAEVRDLTPVTDDAGHVVQLPHLERMFAEALAAIRIAQAQRKPKDRLHWNRILLYVWPALNLAADELSSVMRKLLPETEGLGLEQVVVRARIPSPETGELRDMIVRISSPAGSGLLVTFRPATTLQPIQPLTEYDQKVLRMRQRGFVYPYEIVRMLTPGSDESRAEFPPGEFIEYDLDSEGQMVSVARPHGQNRANIIVGVIRNFTRTYPEGMTRVILLGDPSKDLGALAEPECRRIIGGLDLAERMGVPLEWFPISAGAKISMESGVENMDWIASVLRRLVQFTQNGGEVNLIINGINVGAQPYWNAEATMLMHTRGILVMTPKAAMVLTGKRALDYSGSVSAEDNEGIGGYDRIMGVNGQAQYWARDINDACHILFRHYEHTYVAQAERFPRRAPTSDPFDRNVCEYPHTTNGEDGFMFVGDIFSDKTNPGRKKSFDVRRVMLAVTDQDHTPLERWPGMRAAETTVVWDAHLGGYPVCLIGIESRPVPRIGFVPADGPDQWCAGTFFPQSSKKVARAINAASNNRPVVLLANLSGFDGSPESMRKLQLEYGAEIGRAVVNFKGPMVFCVISRYHGGAYVVFSRMLNEQLKVVALEGTYASVIGGAPAAAVVFAGEVESRTRKDARLIELGAAIEQAQGAEKSRLRTQWDELFKLTHSEKLGQVAEEFDHIHSVQRALKVGALHEIIPPANLRPYLIQAIQSTVHAFEPPQELQREELVSEEKVRAA